MRKKFVYFVIVPVVLITLVLYFFLDSWIEYGLEYAGEKAVGAKVEIDHLRLTLVPVGIEIARVQVTDPNDGWKNLCETGKIKFALNVGQLLRSKYIVETMEVNNLILGTKRVSDGSIPKPKEEAAVKQLPLDSTGRPIPPPLPLSEQAKPALAPQESKPSSFFDLEKIKRELNTDSLLNPKNLATSRQIDSLKAQISDASAQWQTSLGAMDDAKAKLADLEARAKSINLGNIKDLNSANDALNNAKNILNGVNDVKASVEGPKTALTDAVDKFNGSFRELDGLAKQDFNNVLNMAHLPDVSMKGISEMVLGKEMLQKAHEYLSYVDMAKSKINNSSDKPALEKTDRLKGQNIHFPVERSYPKFWIKKIIVSGGTDKAQDPQYFYAKGEILNVSNDQRITGFPITVDLSATKGGTTTLAVGASFDRRKDLAVDNYKVLLTKLPVDNLALGRSEFLPSTVTNASADASITVDVPGNHFDSQAKIAISNMTLAFDRTPNTLVERIVRDVLASIKGFHVDLRMWQNKDKFDVAFATDLDDLLASRTKEVIGAEVARIQNDLRNKLNAQIAGKRAEVEKLYNEKREMVMEKLKEYEKQANEQLAVIEGKKKEIEDRIDQEKNKKTDEVKKKAEDALKGLIKRF